MTLEVVDVRLATEPVALDGDLRLAVEASWGDDGGVLLAHTMEGVVWGRLVQRSLRTSPDAPRLAGETLLDLRVFSEASELRIWRGDAGLTALRVREAPDGTLAFAARQDRSYQLLRAPQARVQDAEFVTFRGLAGERQMVPGHPVPRGVYVRHYYERDPDTGLLRLAEHRWLKLEPQEGP